MSTAIIVLTYNGLHLLKDCLESVYRFTVSPYKLYVVEQGSKDGTLDWLHSFCEARSVEIESIVNSENVGFPKGCNQAFERVTESNICLLNNDTIVSPFWLTRLLTHLGEEFPIVGPSTSRGSQQVLREYLKVSTEVTVDEVALRSLHVYETLQGKVQAYPHLTGFCLLFGKALIDKHGMFDESFGLGCGEEIDFCWRVTKGEERRCLWVKEVYVHHHHNATFNMLGVDLRKQSSAARAILVRKWPHLRKK